MPTRSYGLAGRIGLISSLAFTLTYVPHPAFATTLLTGSGTLGVSGAVDGGEGAGYMVMSGTTTVNNATLSNFLTTGGSGSGGGAGLGGVFFVNNGATLILNNVDMVNNLAIGGTGGSGTVGGTLNSYAASTSAGTTGTAGANAYDPSFGDGNGNGLAGLSGRSGGNGVSGTGGTGGAGGTGGQGWVYNKPATAAVAIATATLAFDTIQSGVLTEKAATETAAAVVEEATAASLEVAAAAEAASGAEFTAAAVAEAAAAQGEIVAAAAEATAAKDAAVAANDTAFAVKFAAEQLPTDVAALASATLALTTWNTAESHGSVGQGGAGGQGGIGGAGSFGFGGGAGGAGGQGGIQCLNLVGSCSSTGSAPDGIGGSGGQGGLGGFGGGGGGGGNGGASNQSSANPNLPGAAGAGGQGGFGGGVGSTGSVTLPTGTVIAATGGGGGSGFGGGIFVAATGSLQINGDATFAGNNVAGGNSLNGGSSGQAIGSDIFAMTGASVALTPGLGHTQTYGGTLADDSTASIGSSTSTPAGSGVNVTIGAGKVIFTGNNTSSGQTILLANAVLQADDGVGLSTHSNLTFNGGVLQTGAGSFTRSLGTTAGNRLHWIGSGGFAAVDQDLTVTLNAGQALAWGSGNFVSGSNALLFGSSSATNSVTFTNNIILNGATAHFNVRANSTNTDTATLSGVLSNGSGTSNIVVNGDGSTGKLILTNANTYTGTTTVSAGTLALSGSGSIAASSAVGVADNATFDISATTSGASVIDLAGTSNASVALGAKTLTLTNENDTFAGVIGGTGGLTLQAGTLALSGQNTFTGMTTASSGTLILTGAIVGGLTNSATVYAQGTMNGPILNQSSGSIALTGDLAGNGTLTNNATATLYVGSHALTGLTTLTNNSTSATAVQIAAGGSIGTLAAPTAILNTAGTFTNVGTVDASTLSNTGGTLQTTGTINAATSLTNAATLYAQGTITTPTLTNTGTLALSGALTGPITNVVNNGTGQLYTNAQAWTRIETLTNNSTSSTAVQIAAGGSIGTLSAPTAILNTAGTFNNSGTVNASTISNTGGTFYTSGTTRAGTSIVNAATMVAQGTIVTPLLTNTGTFGLSANLAGPITNVVNSGTGTFDIGTHALTGVGTFTNNSTASDANHPAVYIGVGGSLDTAGARAAVVNTAGFFSNWGTIDVTTVNNTGGTLQSTGTIDASVSLTNAATMVAQGTIVTPLLTNTGTFGLSANLAGPIGAFTNNGTGTVNIGTHALTGVGTFTNTSTASDPSNAAVFIDVGGSLDTAGARAAVINTAGLFGSKGTIYATTLSNTGGAFMNIGTIDASVSVTNAATLYSSGTITTATLGNTAGTLTTTGTVAATTSITNAASLYAEGTITTPTLTNTGTVALSGDLAGSITNVVNNDTGEIYTNAHAWTGIATLTNNSTSASAIQIASGGLIGTSGAPTAIVNTAGIFTNAGTVNASTFANTGGTLYTIGTIDAATSITNAASLYAQGTIATPTLTNTGTFALHGDLAGPITDLINNGTGQIYTNAHALTGIGTLTNNSTSASALQIASGGSIGTSASRTVFANTAGTVTNAGTLYASTFGNSGGTLVTTGTIDASTSITNAATLYAEGTITTPLLTNTGSVTLTNALGGTITALTNTSTGTLTIGAYALTGVGTLTNSSTSASAVQVASGGSIGTSDARTAIANTAGTFTNAGTLSLGTLGNTGGTFISTGTLNASGTMSNSATMTLSGSVYGALSNTGAGTMTVSGTLGGSSSLVNADTAQVLVTGGDYAGVTTLTNSSTTVDGVLIAKTLTASGLVSNSTGAFMRIASGGSLVAPAGVSNASGATLTIDQGGSVIDDLANSGTVLNSGSYTANATNTGSSASLTNTSSGTFTGNLVNSSGATATNQGQWTGTAQNAATLGNASGAIWTGSFTNLSGGTLTNDGTVTGSLTNAGTASNTGTILRGVANSGGTLTTTGAIYGGLANTGTANAQGSISGAIANTGTGAFTVTGGLVADNTFANTDSATATVGAFALSGVTTFTNSSTSANAVQIAAGGSIGTTAAPTALVTTAGTITNAGTLNLSTLTATGGQFVTSGTVNAATSVTNTASMTIAGQLNTPILYNSGALQLTGSLGANTAVTNDGSFDLSGAASAPAITTFQGLGSVTLGSNSLILSNASGTISGAISGSGGLVVNGGTATLTGLNTYTGGTIVNNATVAVSRDEALGAASGTLSLNNGTLTTLGSFATSRPIALTGTGTLNTANQTIAVNGVISGTGMLVASGGGSLALNTANTYSGGTKIVGNTTVLVGSDAALGASSGPVVIASGTLSATNAFSTTRTVEILKNGALASNGFDVQLTGQIFVTTPSGSVVAVTTGSANLDGDWTLSGDGGLAVGGSVHGVGVVSQATSISGTLVPGNSPGTLTFSNSVVMKPGSNTTFNIDGLGTGSERGNYSRAIVTGAGNSFTADGTLTPLLTGITGDATNTFVPKVGNAFTTIIAEGGLLGSYRSLNQPGSAVYASNGDVVSGGLSAGTRFDTVYAPTTLTLFVTPATYTNLTVLGTTLTKNQAAVGIGLDGLRVTPGTRNPASFTPVLTQLYSEPVAALPSLLDHASGSIYGDAASSTLRQALRLNETISDQNAQRRGSPGGRPTAITIDGVTAWGSMTRQATTLGGLGGVGSGFGFTDYGGTGGVEWGNADVAFGLVTAYSSGSLRSRGTNASAETQTGQVGAYGSLTMDSFFAEGQVAGHFGSAQAHRSLTEFGLTAKGDDRLLGASTKVDVGARYHSTFVDIEPTIGASVTSVSNGAFTESGADILSLNVKSGGASDVRSMAGLRAEAVVATFADVTIVPSLQVQIAHRFGSDTVATASAFSGDPQVDFTTKSVKSSADSLTSTVGVAVRAPKGLSAFVNYHFELERLGSSQTVQTGVNVPW